MRTAAITACLILLWSTSANAVEFPSWGDPPWTLDAMCQHEEYIGFPFEACQGGEGDSHAAALREWKAAKPAVRKSCIEKELRGVATYSGLNMCLACDGGC